MTQVNVCGEPSPYTLGKKCCSTLFELRVVDGNPYLACVLCDSVVPVEDVVNKLKAVGVVDNG